MRDIVLLHKGDQISEKRKSVPGPSKRPVVEGVLLVLGDCEVSPTTRLRDAPQEESSQTTKHKKVRAVRLASSIPLETEVAPFPVVKSQER